jgi:hypothetical protein
VLGASEPNRCVLIDATVPKNEVAERIWGVVNKRFDPAMAPMALEGLSA